MKKAIKEDTSELMQELTDILKSINNFESTTISDTVKNWIKSKEIGFGKVMMPLRLALVGSLQGPDLFEICAILGKEESIRRIEYFINNS